MFPLGLQVIVFGVLCFSNVVPRFTVETLDIPAAGHLKKLDVDNALSLEDWRASGLGPCAAMHFDRQVLGEYPNSEEVRACAAIAEDRPWSWLLFLLVSLWWWSSSSLSWQPSL